MRCRSSISKEGDQGLQIADHGVVRGRIEWDDAHDGRLPLLVIDGRGIDWHQFGRMLMSYEGWQFKLTIADKSEDPEPLGRSPFSMTRFVVASQSAP